MPSGHGIKLGFFHSYRIIGLTLENLNWKKCSTEIFLKITYHRPQRSVCFDEFLQFRRRCLGPPMFQDELGKAGVAHRKLGWIA